MYVSLTTVATGDEPVSSAGIVAEEMSGWLRDMDGFRGFLMLSREGTAIGLTFWENEELAERIRPLRMQFIDRMLSVADVEVEKMEGFEVVFSELDLE